MSDHECEGEYVVEGESNEPIRYKFQIVDIIGIGMTWAGNMFVTSGCALHAVAREVYAAANLRRVESAEYETMSKADSELLEFLDIFGEE